MSKGMINVYTCDRGHRTVTVDRDHGVTPMFIDCPHDECVNDGILDYRFATSCMYRTDQSQTPSHEWYRPGDDETLNPAEREHVNLGGLLLRKISNDWKCRCGCLNNGVNCVRCGFTNDRYFDIKKQSS